MAAPVVDLYRYERACASKIGYETRRSAKVKAQECKRVRGVELSWYKCKYCTRWHLTKQTKEEARTIRRRIRKTEQNGSNDR